MAWTDEQKIDHLLRLPWTIVRDVTPEGDRLLRVRELSSVVGCGQTDVELDADFWDSLATTLRAYLHFHDTIPLPAPIKSLPWESAAPDSGVRGIQVQGNASGQIPAVRELDPTAAAIKPNVLVPA